MWSVSGWDWNNDPAGHVANTIYKQVRGGDVILLHDGGHKQFGTDRSQSVRATDLVLRRYLDEGYSFVTVGEMMNGRAAVDTRQSAATNQHLS